MLFISLEYFCGKDVNLLFHYSLLSQLGYKLKTKLISVMNRIAIE